MKQEESFLTMCLYFTSNRFARKMTRIAEETFKELDIAPSYAYVILLIKNNPGITQQELCSKLSIAPSTSTRFIKKLEGEGLIKRKTRWKTTHFNLSDKGELFSLDVEHALSDLRKQVVTIFGEKNADNLAMYLTDLSEIIKEKG